MASNFYEIKSRWESGSVSKSGSKNDPALKVGSTNSSVLKNGSCAFLKQDLPYNTMYTSRLLLTRELENGTVESRKQENVSENRVIQKNIRTAENVSQAILEVENSSQGSRNVENASLVFRRVDSPLSEEAVNVSHESDEEEIESSLESEPEEILGSESDLPLENDSVAELSEPEPSLQGENHSSEFCDSFSEHLRELETSLKFDSPEKWLFASMEKRNSGASALSLNRFSSCQSDEEDKKYDEFVIRYESDSSHEAEQDGRKTLLPNDRLSELNERHSANSAESQSLQKEFSFADSLSNEEEIEEEEADNFSDSISSDLPFFGDFSDYLSCLIPKKPCRRSSTFCGSRLVKPICKSTQFKMTPEVVATEGVGDGKIVVTHRRTSSLFVPLSFVEASLMAESTRMTDSTQVTDLTPVMDSMEGTVQRERKSTDGERRLLKMMVRRGRVIEEILDTEVTYQTHLALIIKFFERPLREMNILSDHVVLSIFGNVEQLMAVNTELLIHLKSLSIGEAFRRLGPFLKLYSTYANNHERALAALMDWDQKSPEFARFRRTQEDHPEMKGLKLNALLITPVQRIPRYKLLLEELLANTLPDHKDHANIAEAVKQMTAVASHINEHIKQQDNFMKMLAIQRSLTGPVGSQIFVPGRIFIKEGSLRKVSKNGGRSHDRMFYLFSDVLMYAKPRLLDGVPRCNTFTCCCILPLHHCKVDQVLGHSQGQGSLFTVQCKDESLLLFSDQKTVNSWIIALRNAINEVQASRQSLRKTSSAKEPMRGGAILQFLKREKKTDPLVLKNSRPCNMSKHKTNHRDKISLDPIKSCPDEHENIHPNENVASSTPKKRLLGFGCLRKRRMQIFPESATFTSPKNRPFARDTHPRTKHGGFASDILDQSQSSTSPLSSTDRSEVFIQRNRPVAATSISIAEESRFANSSIDSVVIDDTVLLPKRQHKNLKKPS